MRIERRPIDPGILGVDVDQPVAELVQGGDVIHLHPDEVRRVVVEPEARAREVGEHPPPDRRARGQVLAAGPLVVGEEHRAVLDPDAHAFLLGVADQRPPDLEEPGPVGVDRQRGVSPHEGIHDPDPQLGRGVDDLEQVRDRHVRLGPIGRQRVRIVSQSRDRHAGTGRQVTQPSDIVGARHVQVRHPRIATLGASRRPAHQLDAREPLLGGEPHHLFGGIFRQDRRDESEFHDVMSTH